MVKRVGSLAFVYTSASGLPFAAVSKGTAGGMLVPRRRKYCEAVSAVVWNVMLKNALLSVAVSDFQALAPAPLNVLITAALVFLAASGTAERSAVVPSALSQLVLRGHSPA